MKALRKISAVSVILVVALLLIFFAGRYGWKLAGFRACQGAEIASVEVGEKAVQIVGSYPGACSKGFCGCYSEERDGKLYVGFRFSAVFGFFETGNFALTIPVKGTVDEVILKTRTHETTLWKAQTGPVFQND